MVYQWISIAYLQELELIIPRDMKLVGVELLLHLTHHEQLFDLKLLVVVVVVVVDVVDGDGFGRLD